MYVTHAIDDKTSNINQINLLILLLVLNMLDKPCTVISSNVDLMLLKFFECCLHEFTNF